MIMLGYKEAFINCLPALQSIPIQSTNFKQTLNVLFFWGRFQDKVQREFIVDEPLNTFSGFKAKIF